jgi:A/G-specific adenine glycosylase
MPESAMPRPASELPIQGLSIFQRRLLAWFRRRKRDLPWRRTSHPYRVWISEVMLQQTRVAAVLPHYDRFLRRFPTVRALAKANASDVLRLWAGLGYYSRARNLHRAAREIVALHRGQFPREPRAALALPGIGPYTAAAVLSIAHGVPLAVLDGNVARVLARLCALRGDLRAPRRWRQLQVSAQDILSPRAPGDWNQAMMELGATVCTPRAPRCAECPVAHWCQAFRRGFVDDIPATPKKRVPERVQLAAAVLLDPRRRTFLVRYPPEHTGGADALFSRMWQFPALQCSRAPANALRAYLARKFGIRAIGALALAPARHSVTFREITIHPYLVPVSSLPDTPPARNAQPLLCRTLPLRSLDRLPISNATRKIADAARLHVSG